MCGRMFGGTNKKRKDAPKVNVGDKMGCGVETRAGGVRHLYFTHNSETVCLTYILTYLLTVTMSYRPRSICAVQKESCYSRSVILLINVKN